MNCKDCTQEPVPGYLMNYPIQRRASVLSTNFRYIALIFKLHIIILFYFIHALFV